MIGKSGWVKIKSQSWGEENQSKLISFYFLRYRNAIKKHEHFSNSWFQSSYFVEQMWTSASYIDTKVVYFSYIDTKVVDFWSFIDLN